MRSVDMGGERSENLKDRIELYRRELLKGAAIGLPITAGISVSSSSSAAAESNSGTFEEPFSTQDTGYNPQKWDLKSYKNAGTATQTGNDSMRIYSAIYDYHGIQSDRTFEPPLKLTFTINEWSSNYGSSVYVGFINPESYLDDGRSAAPNGRAYDSVHCAFKRPESGLRLMTQKDSPVRQEGDATKNQYFVQKTKSELNWGQQSQHQFELIWTKDKVALSMDGKQIFESTQHIPAGPYPLYILGHEWTGYDITEIVISDLTVQSTSKPKANLTLEHPRPVQTVTNTRLMNVADSRVKDPPLVAGKPASITFGLSAQGLADIPDGATVPVELSTTGTDVGSLPDFELSRQRLVSIATANYPIVELFEIFYIKRQRENKELPIFSPSADLESITIQVKDVETDSYEIKGHEITLHEGTDFEVRGPLSLTVGVTTVKAPLEPSKLGVKPAYGDGETGTIAHDISEDADEREATLTALSNFATNLEVFLKDEYPASEVTVKTTSKIIRGEKNNCEAIYRDFSDAYSAVYDEFSNADVALLVVPNKDGVTSDGEPKTQGYYEYHEIDASGMEVGFEDSSFQPKMAASALWTSNLLPTSTTAAQEITHHFLPSNSYSKPYTLDGNHVVPDKGKSGGVVSTGITINQNTFLASDSSTDSADDAESDHHSFMSYAPSSAIMTSDALTHRKLINSGLTPHPHEEDTDDEEKTTLYEGLQCATEGDITNLTFTSGYPFPNSETGSVLVQVLDGEGNVIDERRTARVKRTHDGSGGDVADVTQFSVPFESSAAEVRLETETTQTTVNPVTDTLSETVSALPAEAFKNNPSHRRSTLQQKLDVVDDQMRADKYRAASNKLENDVFDKLQKWLVTTESQFWNVPTKQEAVDQCKRLVKHLDTLAEMFGNGNRNGRG